MCHEYWERIITECNQSGMQKKDWMKVHNINPKSFYRWQKILRDEAAITLLSFEQDKFLELKVGWLLLMCQRNLAGFFNSFPSILVCQF